MQPAEVFWHRYPREEIKPAIRGNLVYVLEIPRRGDTSVTRHIFDKTGKSFPHASKLIPALLASANNAIIFDGISKGSVYDALLCDPAIDKRDKSFINYNRSLICSSRRFFLSRPGAGFDTLPITAVRLLCGELPTQPKLSLNY